MLVLGLRPTNLSAFKLPPKIRVLDLFGMGLALKYDSHVPLTLEELALDESFAPLSAQDLKHFFNAKSLRRLFVTEHKTPFADGHILDMLPNLEMTDFEEYKETGRCAVDIDKIRSLKTVSKKLEALTLFSSSKQVISLKDIPPSLKELSIAGDINIEELAELPKSLLTSNLLHRALCPSKGLLPSFPRRLTSLDVSLRFFNSETDFHALPETIENLTLTVGRSEWVRLSFPAPMKKHLRTLDLRISSDEHLSLIKELSCFALLSSLSIHGYIVLTNDALSSLPKSLANLSTSWRWRKIRILRKAHFRDYPKAPRAFFS